MNDEYSRPEAEDPEGDADLEGDFLEEEGEFPSEVMLMERGSACNVTADYVEMYQSASMMTMGDEVGMTESASMIIVADDVEAHNSSAVLVIAADVEGEISTVFTPLTAAIFGAAMGAALFMLNLLFRPRR